MVDWVDIVAVAVRIVVGGVYDVVDVYGVGGSSFALGGVLVDG